uniref:DNA cytosine methyltransferase n=1 Tax=Brevundimonas sp. TaxID=1871086 RepID=UPI0025BE6820
WHPLGWRAAFLSEIEAFPRAILQHHYPEVPLHGDFTTIRADEYEPIDLLVGGTPCQSFSVAGLRGGLDDDRGNLALEYLRLADRLRPRWLVWENVPGVLSSNGGRDFGAILGGMVELGYGFAYRVLDAQFFGVAQRRRRVFVVGYAGDWRRAAAVLFERHSLSGHPAPRREARKDLAPTISARPTGGGGLGTDFDLDGGVIARRWPADVSPTLNAAFGSKLGLENQHIDSGAGMFVTHAIQAGALRENPTSGPDGVGVQEGVSYTLEARAEVQAVAYRVAGDGAAYREGDATAPLTTGTDSSASIVTFGTTQITSTANYSSPKSGDPCHPLAAGAHAPAVAFSIMPMNSGKDFKGRETDVAQPVMAAGPAGGNQGGDYIVQSAVRRLTPRECERLQGFPDDYTLIPYRKGMAADGPRYKTLGNSMAVPVMRWIGERIAQVDAIPHTRNEKVAA